MEADRLSEGIAPLIFKLGSRWKWIDCLPWPLYCQRKALVFIELEAVWALELV